MKRMLSAIKKLIKRQRGFTLVEMVTVVAIMGVMAAVAVPMVSTQLGKARDKSYAQDKAMIQTAVDSFFTDSNNVRFQGQRQYPILGANSGVDNSATGGENREAEQANPFIVTDSDTDLATPLNPLRGTQGGEPKWMDGPLGAPDSNRIAEDNLNAEAESIAEVAFGWYVTRVIRNVDDFAVDTRDYFVDFRKLVDSGLLQKVPESASLDNGGGISGSYSWYVKANGAVESLFFFFPESGLDFGEADPAIQQADDLRGYFDGVYP